MTGIHGETSTTLDDLFRRTVTPSDIPVIKECIHNTEVEIKGNQHEIDKFRATILALENKQKRLKRAVKQYRALLSPVYRMPPEILMKIFRHCGTPNMLEEGRTSVAMSVSMVSARWRELAIATPELWSSMVFPIFRWFHVENAPDLLLQLARLFLDRSQNATLTVNIVVGTLDDYHPFLALFELLVENSTRWRSFRLGASASLLQHRVFHPIRGQLPRLESLSIFTFDERRIDPPLTLFGDCPSLRSLTVGRPSTVEDLVIPLQQVKILTVHQTSSPNTLSTLSLLPNAVRVNICNPLAVDRHITSNVKTMTIVASRKEHLSNVFDHTTLPKLTSLLISSDNAESWTVSDDIPLRSFIERSCCAITTLRLKSVPMSDKQAIAMLRVMPSLTDLYVEERKERLVTRDFLSRLSVDLEHYSPLESPAHFLPNLTNLSLKIPELEPEGAEAIRKAVESRWLPDDGAVPRGGVECLESVTIQITGEESDSIPTDVFESLQYLRGAGLRLTIITP
ncbi:hypothetical protein VNI00_002368 [Paramarasmius palmivorus]|uniref:F-box domain-containing protein n=1 Tax=Paramarasmius palmivorus TaxID=297713 RepID=A0AAW0DVN8_9AGAR